MKRLLLVLQVLILILAMLLLSGCLFIVRDDFGSNLSAKLIQGVVAQGGFPFFF